jgi:hypothetical protein
METIQATPEIVQQFVSLLLGIEPENDFMIAPGYLLDVMVVNG